MQSLCQKLEKAAFVLVDNLQSGIAIQRGVSSDTKVVPALTLSVSGGPEFPQGSGNFTLSLMCEFRGNADDYTPDEHAIVTEELLAPMMSDDLANELSAAGVNFNAFGISNRQASQSIDERSHVSTLTMDVYCCGLSFA
jgi:hypothetical protein